MLKNKNILYPELSYKLNNLFYKTHNKLGRYRNEKQYADYFELLLKKNELIYERELELLISFDGEKKRRNIVDFIIEDKIIIDFKTKTLITKEDYFQMQRYLISSGKESGIIINFRQKSIKPKRVLNVKLYNEKNNSNSEHSDDNSD